MSNLPTLEEEKSLWKRGFSFVAGVDEAGRGPLAGPVMAASVILSPFSSPSWLPLVKDSKELSPRGRERAFDRICQGALAFGLGAVSPKEVDCLGIGKATRLAMVLAVSQLPFPPDFVLVDGRERLELEMPQKALVKGDRTSFSIAAASILAKVTRDRLMQEMDLLYPGWGFARHKGYATAKHLERLNILGPSPIHRRSFSPVAQLILKEG